MLKNAKNGLTFPTLYGTIFECKKGIDGEDILQWNPKESWRLV